MGETITISGASNPEFNGTFEVTEKTSPCPCCGKPMTENEMINAGLIHDPNETWEQFQGRTGQND